MVSNLAKIVLAALFLIPTSCSMKYSTHKSYSEPPLFQETIPEVKEPLDYELEKFQLNLYHDGIYYGPLNKKRVRSC